MDYGEQWLEERRSRTEVNNSLEQNVGESPQLHPQIQGRQNVSLIGGPGSVINYYNYEPPDGTKLDSGTNTDIDRVDESAKSEGKNAAMEGPCVDTSTLDADVDKRFSDNGNDYDNDRVDKIIKDEDDDEDDGGEFVQAMEVPYGDNPTREADVDKQHSSELVLSPSSLNLKIASPRRRLVLVGYTGCGKSEVGNSILCDRDRFDSRPGFASVTKACQRSSGQDLRFTGRDTREVVVVDTPGVSDTNDDPDVIAKKITECIIYAAPGPHAILLIAPITRMTTEIKEAADKLRHFFGDRSLQYMIVVFTHLDAIKRNKRIEGIQSLIEKSPPALYRILQECNNRYVAFDNTLDADSQENKDQVTRLFDLVDTMVAANGGRYYTNDLLEEANRLVEIEKKQRKEEIEKEFKPRVARIRAEYEKQLEKIDVLQKRLEEVQQRNLDAEGKMITELRSTIERQQSQIQAQKEEEEDLKVKEVALEEQLKDAVKEKFEKAVYLAGLQEEFLNTLQISLNVGKPPKRLVDAVASVVANAAANAAANVSDTVTANSSCCIL